MDEGENEAERQSPPEPVHLKSRNEIGCNKNENGIDDKCKKPQCQDVDRECQKDK